MMMTFSHKRIRYGKKSFIMIQSSHNGGWFMEKVKHIFTHKADKSQIPTTDILGVNIADINMTQLMAFTVENLEKLKGDYLCVSNVHTTVTAYEQEQYRQIQNSGIMAIPDGNPLAVVGRRRGGKNIERITGLAYMKAVFAISREKHYRHFFYGSTQNTLDKMCENLKREYPYLNIAGTYSPPFRELTEKENNEVVALLNNANADFIWIGLGAIKQEVFMWEHQGTVNGFMIGVGAGFDYLAGNIKRAPEFMQRHSLEWLFRLFQEPKRLFKRYLYTNTKFLWHIFIKRK